MRSDSREVRITVATLYVRLRDARRRRDEAFACWGCGPRYEAADTESITLNNAIMAIRENLRDNDVSMPASQFVPLVGKLARVRRQARERREMADAN